MKKNHIYIYGIIVIIGGIFLLFSKLYTFDTIKYSIGFLMTIGAIIAFFGALTRIRKQVEFSYHEMHALAMFVYGLAVLIFADTVETLAYYSFILFLFYTFSEIIFCNWLFNLDRSVFNKIVLIRVLLALLVGVGSIAIMFYNDMDKTLVVQGFGLLFIIIGVNILLYTPVMKAKKINPVENNL